MEAETFFETKFHKIFNARAFNPAYCKTDVPVAQPLFKDTEKKISEIENEVRNEFKILIFSCIWFVFRKLMPRLCTFGKGYCGFF